MPEQEDKTKKLKVLGVEQARNDRMILVTAIEPPSKYNGRWLVTQEQAQAVQVGSEATIVYRRGKLKKPDTPGKFDNEYWLDVQSVNSIATEPDDVPIAPSSAPTVSIVPVKEEETAPAPDKTRPTTEVRLSFWFEPGSALNSRDLSIMKQVALKAGVETAIALQQINGSTTGHSIASDVIAHATEYLRWMLKDVVFQYEDQFEDLEGKAHA